MARNRRPPPRRRFQSPPRRHVPWRWLALVGAIALLAAGGLIYVSTQNSAPAVAKTPLEMAQGASLGSPQAKVTVEVFSDFL